ncbi:hypothetical protein [Brachybacterium paraconglomeratum]|uniref:hypothetical protein n=1 Tax=Brachybacterium paraconglomeratum TaxID=173362 RepID=UPI003F7B8BF4
MNFFFGGIFFAGAYIVITSPGGDGGSLDPEAFLDRAGSMGVVAAEGVMELFGASIAVLFGCLLAIVGGNFSASSKSEESGHRTLVLLLSNIAFAATVPASVAVVIAVIQERVPTGVLLILVPAFLIVGAMSVGVGTFDVSSRDVKLDAARRELRTSKEQWRTLRPVQRGSVALDSVVIGGSLIAVAYIALLVGAIATAGHAESPGALIVGAGLWVAALSMISVRFAIEVSAVRILGAMGRSRDENLSSLYIMFSLLMLQVVLTLSANGAIRAVLACGALVSLLICVFACIDQRKVDIANLVEWWDAGAGSVLGFRKATLKRSKQIAYADLERARKLQTTLKGGRA